LVRFRFFSSASFTSFSCNCLLLQISLDLSQMHSDFPFFTHSFCVMLSKFFFLFISVTLSIGAQNSAESKDCNFQGNFEIHNFYVQDFSRNLFYIEVKAQDRTTLPKMIVFKEDGVKNEFDKKRRASSKT
jgi:hypothetical protein